MSNFYILVMDKNLTGTEGIWYITSSSDNIQQLQTITSHDDTLVMQLLKTFYRSATGYSPRRNVLDIAVYLESR